MQSRKHLHIRMSYMHVNIVRAATAATATARAHVWSYIAGVSRASKYKLSLSICSVMPFLASTTVCSKFYHLSTCSHLFYSHCHHLYTVCVWGGGMGEASDAVTSSHDGASWKSIFPNQPPYMTRAQLPHAHPTVLHSPSSNSKPIVA